MTGIPGHGGGKRFAVEQEMVAAATRGAIRQLDLAAIQGRRVNLYVNAIGDTGSGNLVGGRFNLVSQLRGDYIQTPPTIQQSTYPQVTSTTSQTSNSESSSRSSGVTTTSDSGSESSSTTSSQGTSPVWSSSQQDGFGSEMQAGIQYEGLGAYQNSEEITSNDLQYLSALMEAYLFLRGVQVVPPSEAEVDVYITVDVFGTVRTRVEWFLANNEILVAKTALEVMAIDHSSGQLLMHPQAVGAEAEYNEQYILWAGPVRVDTYLNKADPLLCDFTDLDDTGAGLEPVQDEEALHYPFHR